MMVPADLEALVAEGVLTAAQARVIRARARGALLELMVRGLLGCGVLAAATGFILWLQAPLPIAGVGAGFLAAGLIVLQTGGPLWRMFGQAATLIGAAMLAGGGVIELYDRVEGPAAGLWLALAGAAITLPAFAFAGQPRFVAGAFLLAGAALHLGGFYSALDEARTGGLAALALSLYATVVLLLIGWKLDLRGITALAIVPFAQIPEPAPDPFWSLWALFSREPTVTLVQMALAGAACAWLIRRFEGRRMARHAMLFAVMAFTVAACSFLQGSLDGDVPLESYALAGFADWRSEGLSYEALQAAQAAWRAKALVIPQGAFALAFALVLLVTAVLAARHLQRGLFNLTVFFAVIHGYSQHFDRFGDEPLGWVVAGLAAIPIAWAIWRMNRQFG